MHTSDALSRLQNIADTPNNKDIIPLNYVYNTKSIDTTQVKRKCSRLPKSQIENSNSNLKNTTAAATHTA